MLSEPPWKRKCCVEKPFEEIMAENSSTLAKDLNLQVEVVPCIDAKKFTSRHTTIKLLNIKTSPEHNRGKMMHCLWRNSSLNICGSSAETRKWNNVVEAVTEEPGT